MSALRRHQLASIRRARTLTEARLRLARAVGVAPALVTLALALAAVLIALCKLVPHAVSARLAWELLLSLGIAVIGAAIVVFAWPLRAWSGLSP